MSSWDAFIAWVEAPTAYNWLTLLGVFVGLMTSIFTGYTAATIWADRRPRVSAQWFHEISGERVQVTCEITNGTRKTVIGETAIVKGVLATLDRHNHPPKHESWKSNIAPISVTIPPGGSDTIVFSISPNPAELRKKARRYSSRMGFWFSKVLWQVLHWRLPLGNSFSIRITLRQRSSQIRPIRMAHRIRIYEPSAIQLAEKAEAKAAAK